jgi:hypothetical protein
MQSCKLPGWEVANQRTVLYVLKNNAVKKVWEPWNSRYFKRVRLRWDRLECNVLGWIGIGWDMMG